MARQKCLHCGGGSVDLIGHEENCVMRPPIGYRIDPFADARMGKSLFQMSPSEWLVRDDDPRPTPTDEGEG